ncbi:MAG: asparagine synthase (glutamine-hydrolyzing) [Candidatus Nanoarchaeia archaeon]|jgi:asparagine synthase (glutamine-hydrolysing)
MCGIVGFNWKDDPLIKKMADSIKYRGPDQFGYYIDNSISLGHRRLSILDLSEKGKQPMKYKNYIIVFNGEIYNYLEIKEKLKKKGHKFISETDTEMILHAYEEYGVSCVNSFNGMWAFCIYDIIKKKLFISRDRYGVKPLYYYYFKDKFIFASELKAITKHPIKFDINIKGLNYYFYQKYIGQDITIYKNCFKLKAGHNILFDLKTHELKITKYYFLNKEIEKYKNISLKKRLQDVEGILKDAVYSRLISDVPVGSFLSGGIDSSLISAIISKKHKDFKTFSIGFKEKSFDEVPFSKKVSKYIKSKHYVKYIDIDDKIIKHVISNMDEPFGDPSIIPSYLLSKITKEKVSVALSGDGGDEIFGGYDSYKGYYFAKLIPSFSINILRFIAKILPSDNKKLSFSFKIKRFVRDYNTNPVLRHINWMSTFNDNSRKKLLLNNFNKINLTNYSHDLTGIQLNDIENYMCEDGLKKVDLASSLNALEVRSPFLDYRLVPLILSLPEKYKITFFETKLLLKKISKNYIPKDIIYRKKRGFSVPISKWIEKSNLIKEYLTNKIYYSNTFLNYDYVQELYNNHIKHKNDNSRELWLIFVFNYWWKNGR